jgi:hypothetical protein
VDVRGESRAALMQRAEALGVQGRASMRKDELAAAIARKEKSRSSAPR